MDNLNGTLLHITTRYDNSYPYDVEVQKLNDKNSSNSYILKGGYAVSLFLELSQLLNFSYVLVPTVHTYDFTPPVGSEIDLYVGSYNLYTDRARIVDFTYKTGKSRVAAFINHEFEFSMKDTIFGPFQLSLWFGLIGFVCILSGALVIVAIFEKQNIVDAIFQSMSLILQKDSELLRLKRNSSKLIIWITCMANVIILTTYTGNIISIKSVNRYLINSLESLLNSDYAIHLEYGFNNGSSIQVIAEGIKENPTIAKFLKKSADSKYNFKGFHQALRDVKNRPVAYVVDEETGFSVMKSESEQFPCSFDHVPLDGIVYPWAMYMRKHSPYRSALNSGLLRLEEVGVITLARKRWVPKFEGCLVTKTTEFVAISATEIRFGYLILCLGFLCSVLLVLIECCLQNRQTKLKK